jgi:hypothetical protein
MSSAQFKATRTILMVVWMFFVFNILRRFVSLDLIYEGIIAVIGLALIYYGSPRVARALKPKD